MTDGSRQNDLTTSLFFLDWFLWFLDTLVSKYLSVLEDLFIKVVEAHVQAYDVISDLDNVDVDGDGVTKKRVELAHMKVEVKPALNKVN
ncbi:hypothetical protein BH23THE1_BH23THE1_08760 [soil metagenome]